MIETPRIVRTEAQQTAVIHLTVRREEIQQVMGPAIQEVIAAVAAQNIAPSGPVFSHHFRMDPATFDFEVGVPVSKSFAPSGRVQPGTLAPRTVAQAIYRGGYEGLGGGWQAFAAWMAEQGHAPAPDLWERYVAGPESSTNPADWRTELNQPLLER